MYKLFNQQDLGSFNFLNEIYDHYDAIVPQSVYCSDKAHIHVTNNSIAIDFIEALHEPVVRYEFQLPFIHAFGNGKHPTTYMCLALLAETLHIRLKQSLETIHMLDVGTGTGILAIAAYVMGVRHIDAFDASLQAYECAMQNIKDKYTINLYCCDIASFSPTKQYDCITANLMTTCILQNTEKFSSLLAKNGYCIVSGIIDDRQYDVIKAFKNNGCVLKDEQTSQDWFAGLFQKV